MNNSIYTPRRKPQMLDLVTFIILIIAILHAIIASMSGPKIHKI